MKRTKILIFLQSIFAINVISQTGWYRYNWEKVTSDNFNGLTQSVYENDLRVYKDNIYIGEYYKKFSEEMALAVNHDILQGNLYPDFEDSGQYLKKILREVIKDTAILNKIRIYLYR